jgi:hypothetical protein
MAGFLDQLLEELLKFAEQIGCIDGEQLSIDGFFSSGRGGGDQIDYDYKGKGVTSHLLVEKSGKPLAVTSTPASGYSALGKKGEVLERVVGSGLSGLLGKFFKQMDVLK